MTMDASRFDQIARRLGAAQTRRRLIAAAVAMAAGGAGMRAAQAGPPVVPGRTCRPAGAGCTRASQCCTEICATGRQLPRAQRNRCACPDGLAACGGACVDLATNADHCGACGVACGSYETCFSGDCVVVDPCSVDGDKDLASTGC